MSKYSWAKALAPGHMGLRSAASSVDGCGEAVEAAEAAEAAKTQANADEASESLGQELYIYATSDKEPSVTYFIKILSFF